MKPSLVIIAIVLLSVSGALAGPGITISFGSPSYCAPRPVYCAPRPVCAPVYYTRPVVVYPVGYGVYPVQTYQRHRVHSGNRHYSQQGSRTHRMHGQNVRFGGRGFAR